MQKIMHNWQRFWCPREVAYLLTPNGYLADPTEPTNAKFLAHLKANEHLVERSCLVMLGEPGIGKSTEMVALLKASKQNATSVGDKVHSVDLRSVGTEQRLNSKLFDGPEFKAWRDGTYRLHLFLDSLDECLLRVETVAAILADELQNWPLERLHLRIACRTAVWPNVLETALGNSWREESLGIYELLPLREVDVVHAAQNYKIDPTIFLRAVANVRATPFAIKPITLDFLLKTYDRDGKLPASQHELYREGCRILSAEPNDSRLTSGLPTLNSDERLGIASRIAGVMIFGQKSAVSMGADTGGLPNWVLPPRLLAGGMEPLSHSAVEVTERAIREVLDTGLFSSRGQELMGWAHQTYAEFLAAEWVCQNQLSLAGISALTEHRAEGSAKVVPQLYEAAAWIAMQRPDVLEHTAEIDPHVLLRSDVSAMDVVIRERITAQLLIHFENGALLPRSVLNSEPLKALNHPALSQQLKPYLADPSKNEGSRWAAVEIAEACNLIDLQDDLANLALDSKAPYHVRYQAAFAVSRIAGTRCRERLMPLASLSEEEDPNDNLRGCALMALWPECISAEKLFSLLIRPYHPNHLGFYQMFMGQGLIRHLTPTDLPAALRWIVREVGPVMELNPLEDPVGEIMRMAWEYSDTPEVLDELAAVAFQRLELYQSPFQDGRRAMQHPDYPNDANRRRLIDKLVALSIHDPIRLERLLSQSYCLLSHNDLDWLKECLVQLSDKVLRRAYATLLMHALDKSRPEDIDFLLETCQTSDEMRELTTGWFDPIILGSDRATEMREQYERYQEMQRRDTAEPPLLHPNLGAHIEMRLTALETGKPYAWEWLNRILQLEPSSPYPRYELEADLTSLPGWKQADERTRNRIVAGAERFLAQGEPEHEDWTVSGNLPVSAMAGYRAIRLLMILKPEATIGLSGEIWAKWVPIILNYPHLDSDRDQLQEEMIFCAYQRAPSDVIRCLLLAIDRENAQHKYVFVLRRMSRCWDVRLGSALVEKLRDTSLDPVSFRVIMGHLLSLPGEMLKPVLLKTIAVGEELIAEFRNGGSERERAQAAGCELLMAWQPETWRIVWPAIQQDTEFGRHVIEYLVQGHTN